MGIIEFNSEFNSRESIGKCLSIERKDNILKIQFEFNSDVPKLTRQKIINYLLSQGVNIKPLPQS